MTSDGPSMSTTLRPISAVRSPELRPTIPSISSISTPEMKHTFPFRGTNSATPSKSTEQPKRGLDISSLMSPPELQPLDHFRASFAGPSSRAGYQLQDPLSPPISPLTQSDMNGDQAASQNAGSRDPILYPPNATPSPWSTNSLLPSGSVQDRMAIDRIVDKHISARSPQLFTTIEPPTRDDYGLILGLQPNVFQNYNKDPRAWLSAQRQSLQDDRKARLAAIPKTVRAPPRLLPAARSEVSTAHQPSTSRAGAGRNFHSHAHRHVPSARAAPARAAPKAERVAKQRSSPRPERRQAPVTREDKNFEDVVDYTPPLTSIPDKPNCLKSEWKGSPIDLSNDKLRHLLHPEEVKLAASLRLDCATYLTSKRRIFLKRVECFEKGKEFRKTDAQQACNIDVNKASRLHSAYESIGWLDAKWILKFIEERKQHRAANPEVAALQVD